MIAQKPENTNLLIIGMGQYGMVAREIAQAMACFEKIDFLDDNNAGALGTYKQKIQFASNYRYAVVAIGNPQIRNNYIKELQQYFEIATLIHPRSYVSPSAKLGKGCIVEPMAVVHTDAEVGYGCLVSAGAVINHNCVIGACSHLDCNCTVSARTEIAAETKIFAGQTV